MWKHGLVGAVLVGSAWAQVTQRVSVRETAQPARGRDYDQEDGRSAPHDQHASN